ncbi:MFS transporter [Amycolatopsis jejuensis]|uniref:MFS transporter n=1 Tax=Amycolatopsis jejuensis TaxID=330084 RepID=UPI000689572F|nr:MFS transporter [Amycolatopsis jejuensis]
MTAGRRETRRVLVSSFVGTMIEWYDFFLYGSAAALVFGPQFFPKLSPTAGVLASLATFAVGFVARPLGGVVMAHYGDRLGRKSSLVASLVMMGTATVLIGLLPPYSAIGVAAPILLTLLRFVQGIGIGGEWGGAALMAVEHAPKRKRGLYGSAPQMGVPAGLILATFAFLGTTAATSPQQFASWAWRIPFVASSLLIVVALAIRLKVAESPLFVHSRQQGELQGRAPIREILRKHKRTVAIAAGSFIANNAVGYLFMVYTLSYGTSVLKVSRQSMLAAVLVGAVVWLAMIPLCALLSDRYGRRRLYLVGATAMLVWSTVYFLLIDSRNPVLIVVAVGLMALGLAATYAPQSALFAELFPTNVRYTGSSLAYQAGAILGGGPASLVATALHGATGSSWPVMAYMSGLCLVSLLCVLLLRETRHDELGATAVVRSAKADL